MGYEIHVATPKGPDSVRVVREGFVLHSIPMTRDGVNPLRELATLWSLFHLYR